MKKVITIISCCIIIFSIGGCMNREKYMSDWFTSEQEEADKMMEQIIEACRKQDTQKLKELFSENSRKNIKNIDVKINELFQYLKGDIQTFEGDCASSSDSDHGKKIIELDGMYNISTSSEKYHMNFYMYSQNDSDSKAVGLYKIEIATEEIDFYNACVKNLSLEEINQLDALIEKVYLESKKLRKNGFKGVIDEKDSIR